MLHENVRILREMYSRRTVAEAAELMHPAAEMRQPSALPDTDEYFGRENLVRGTRRWLEEWQGFRFVPEEVVDLGERAFMRVRLSGRGKASGVELQQTVFHLWTFRDGRPYAGLDLTGVERRDGAVQAEGAVLAGRHPNSSLRAKPAA